jgi:hypothetical protein
VLTLSRLCWSPVVRSLAFSWTDAGRAFRFFQSITNSNLKRKEIKSMAIVLEANYAKKLGLPGYSSHQYSVSIRTELTDLSQVPEESARLYRQLQDAVDDSIKQAGYLPGDGEPNAVHSGTSAPAAVPGQTNGRRVLSRAAPRSNGSGSHQAAGNGGWRCSDKQRELIEKIVSERQLDKMEVEQIAQEMFGTGVRQLDRLQASGLIDELFERFGGKTPRRNGGKPSTGRVFAS